MPSRDHLRPVPTQTRDQAPADEAHQATVEAVTLGTAMDSPADLAALRGHITAAHFVDPRHGDIWTAIDANHPCNEYDPRHTGAQGEPGVSVTLAVPTASRS